MLLLSMFDKLPQLTPHLSSLNELRAPLWFSISMVFCASSCIMIITSETAELHYVDSIVYIWWSSFKDVVTVEAERIV